MTITFFADFAIPLRPLTGAKMWRAPVSVCRGQMRRRYGDALAAG